MLEEGSDKSQHEDYEKLRGLRHCYPPFEMHCSQLYFEKSAAATSTFLCSLKLINISILMKS
jgi:hypothetical protein